MEVEILHLGEVKFEAIARGHHVICDQPAANGGVDSAMTPPEFLLVSLGSAQDSSRRNTLKRDLCPPTD